MVYFFTFIIVAICFLVFAMSQWMWVLNRARRKGLFPEKGKATMFNVRRLIILGKKDLAIFVYIDIFKVSYRQANQAVDELEKSIREKKSK